MDAALTGLLTGLSLIVAIGAQNAFVLRQGLLRSHVGVVVAICTLSDVALIAAGTVGVGVVVAAHPRVLTVLRWLGAGYLVWFAARSFRSARRPQALRAQADGEGERRQVVLTTLALTWLNPHVYLDTVLMLGNLANQHGVGGRWWFAGGAATGSLVWFAGLGYGSRTLTRALARPGIWRVLDVLIGCVMLAVAAELVFGG